MNPKDVFPRKPLEALRALIQEQAPVRAKKSFGSLSRAGEPIPLRAGQWIEALGEGRWSWSIRFLREREGLRAAWISASKLELFPFGVVQEGIALERILFLEEVPEGQGMDILLQVLRSRLFGVVVFEQELLPRNRQEAQIRKMQLVAEEAGALGILLSERPTSSFGVSIRIETGASGEDDEGRILKVKGGALE